MALNAQTKNYLSNLEQSQKLMKNELLVKEAEKKALQESTKNAHNFFTRAAKSVIHDTVTTFSKGRINRQLNDVDVKNKVDARTKHYQESVDILTNPSNEADITNFEEMLTGIGKKDTPEYLGLLRYMLEKKGNIDMGKVKATLSTCTDVRGAYGALRTHIVVNADEVSHAAKVAAATAAGTPPPIHTPVTAVSDKMKEAIEMAKFEKFTSEYDYLNALPQHSTEASFVETNGTISARTDMSQILKKVGSTAANIGVGVGTKLLLGSAVALTSLSGIGAVGAIGLGYAGVRGTIKYYQETTKAYTVEDFTQSLTKSLGTFFDKQSMPLLATKYKSFAKNKIDINGLVKEIKTSGDKNELKLLYSAFSKMKLEKDFKDNFAMQLTLNELEQSCVSQILTLSDAADVSTVANAKDMLTYNLKAELTNFTGTQNIDHNDIQANRGAGAKAFTTAATSLAGYGVGSVIGAVGQSIMSWSTVGTKACTHEDLLAALKANQNIPKTGLLDNTTQSTAKALAATTQDQVPGFKSAIPTNIVDLNHVEEASKSIGKVASKASVDAVGGGSGSGGSGGGGNVPSNQSWFTAKGLGRWVGDHTGLKTLETETPGSLPDAILNGSPGRWTLQWVGDFYGSLTGQDPNMLNKLDFPTGFNLIRSLFKNVGSDAVGGVDPTMLNPLEAAFMEIKTNFPQRSFQAFALLLTYATIRHKFPNVAVTDKKVLAKMNAFVKHPAVWGTALAFDPITTLGLMVGKKIGDFAAPLGMQPFNYVGKTIAGLLPKKATTTP